MSLNQFLFILACLFVPIVWGVLVHQAFEFLNKRFKKSSDKHDPKFPDFQI